MIRNGDYILQPNFDYLNRMYEANWYQINQLKQDVGLTGFEDVIETPHTLTTPIYFRFTDCPPCKACVEIHKQPGTPKHRAKYVGSTEVFCNDARRLVGRK